MRSKKVEASERSTSLFNLVLRHYWYFPFIWLVLTGIVLYCYETQFDRVRICTYQYCPSRLVLAACVGCIVVGMMWADVFFRVIRPMLQLAIGKFLGTRIRSDRNSDQSLLEIALTDGNRDYWEPSANAPIRKHLLVSFVDLLCVLLFLVVPITAILAAASGIAYLEQQSAPTPPGLVGIGQ